MDLSPLDPFPILETKRLQLGTLQAQHAAPLLEILGDPEVTRFHDLETMTEPKQTLYFIAEMLERHQQRTGLRWAAVERTTGRLLGTVGLNHINTESCHAGLGYEFRRDIWGQGFGSEAVQAVVQFGHQRLGLNRIEAAVMPKNAASLALLGKLGFTNEGCLRALGYWKGSFHDLQFLSLLSSDPIRPSSDA